MTELNHELLREYANSFRTYGNLTNQVWFLGLEEGGARSLEEAKAKICKWKNSGSKVEEYLSGPRVQPREDNKYLPTNGKQAQLQKTWSNQLRVLLGIQGEKLSNESVRILQTTAHGTNGGPTCLMELFPLPCKNAGAWVYDKVAFDHKVPVNEFSTKKSYYQAYLPRRVEKLKTLILTYNPRILVCMTWTHRDSLLPLMNREDRIELVIPGCSGKAIIGICGQTVMVVCTHPGARGFRGQLNKFYFNIGQAIKRRVDDLSAAS